MVEAEYFFKLLQFLSFIRDLKGSKLFVGNQGYYLITFPVADFLRFTGVKKKSQYQLTKVLNFLKSLQKLDPMVNNFSDTSFRSSVLFPYLELKKQNLN